MAIHDDLLTVRRLSQYRPFEGGGASAREAQQDLVLAAMAESDWSCDSISVCSETVATLFRVELDPLQTADAIKQLVADGRVEARRGAGFVLTEDEQSRMAAAASESQEVADEALAEWNSYLLEQWPGLLPEHLQRLGDDLRLFLQTVIARHGAEASMLLYPEDPRADDLYGTLEDAGFKVFDSAPPEVAAIRDAAVSYFVRRPTDVQRAFLAQTLNTGYFLTVLSIDPEGAHLVRELVSGQYVYIDTNFVFRLLGIQGPRHVRPARTILEWTREAGYTVCVTPWTVEEYRFSLDRGRRDLHRFPVSPSQYGDLLADATSDEDFVTAYWRQVKDSPVTIDDFYAHWIEVESHLSALGIEVRSQGCEAIDQRHEQVTDEISVLAKVLHGRYRHPSLLEHDVKHRLLVERLRGSGNRTFANAGYFFLTFDSVLPRYDFHARRESRSPLPFCVSAGSWFQIIAAFRPKTDDQAKTLADLLASPYVRYRRTLSKDKASQVVARVQLHSGGDPHLAARVMMNSVLIKEIEESSSEDVIETIDNAIVEAAQQAQQDARRAQEAAAQERERAEQLESEAQATVAAAEARAAADRENAEALHEEALRHERARAEAAERAEKARAETRLREEQERHAQRLERLTTEHSAILTKAQADAQRASRRLRGAVACVLLALLALVGLLAVGLAAVWAAIIAIATVAGLLAAIDQLWIRRGGND